MELAVSSCGQGEGARPRAPQIRRPGTAALPEAENAQTSNLTIPQSHNPTHPEDILLIKHGALGDFVKATGKMFAIRARHPHARLTLLTQRFLADLARRTGLFDEILFDERTYAPADWWRIVKRLLADRAWSRVYDLQSSNRTLCRYYPLARLLTRHPMRWGRIAPGGFLFRCTPAKRPLAWSRAHTERVEMDFPPSDLSFCRGEGAHFGLLPARYALLIPGCSATSPQKRWPSERYRALSRFLAARGLKSVVLGTKAEAAAIRAVAEGNPDAVDFTDRAALADIPELARRAALVVGNDTGPAHMARLVGAPTLMLFTAYDAARAAARAPHVVNLVGHNIGDIATEAVCDAAAQLLDMKKMEKKENSPT